MAKNKNLEINNVSKNPNALISEKQLKKIKIKRIVIISLLSILAIASIVSLILVFVFVKK